MSATISTNDAHPGLQQGEQLHTSRWTPLQILVVAICTVINALDGMDLLIMSYIAPAMAADWHVGFATLGVVFSAGLAGMLVGCVVVAPFADTLGRRPIVLLALVLMTIGAVGSGFANSIVVFSALRALTGIGLGTLLASVAALVSEYAPAGRRSLAVGIFQAGYPIGAVATGVVAIYTIPAFGWKATLIGAGAISAVLLPCIWVLLPESVAFLESRQPAGALALSNSLRRRMGWSELPVLPPRAMAGNLPKPRDLLAPELRQATIALWISTFLSFGVLYFVTSWIPKIAVVAGLTQANALWSGSIFNLGGVVGDLAIGWLAVRRSIGKLIALFFMVCAVLMMIFAQQLSLAFVLITAFGLGFTLQGGFSAFYSLSAQLYPARVRSSGIGWAVGIGRGGAIIGPMVGGALLAAKLPLWITFACFAVPLIVAGWFAVLASRMHQLSVSDK
ncbi:MFS transporter [Paraburkholderia sp. CNPSo 3272]|uniref:MFS transporter n=1 Tax=Paraburkholderia sp. CNPSo 3272 TaxID=2940931 RepID=UPI0020B6BADD|nr:MFS transporter [Paraburkholderia sp. CNPSo 3272]MCP3724005.1 MFS transporter [Paraburkholderia sp. CNPSo 3272]